MPDTLTPSIISNFDLTEDQQQIRDTVRDFAEAELKPIAAQCDEEQKVAIDQIKKLGELGFLGITIPEQYGGSGFDSLSYILMIEELGRVDASTCLGVAAHVSLGTYPIYAFGNEAQRQEFLPPLCAGEYLGCFGLTEPDSGSDAAGMKTTAVLKDGHYVVNGSKQYITNPAYAGSCVFTARTDPSDQSHKSIAAFVTKIPQEGLEVGPKESKLGCRGSDTRPLFFRDMKLPAESILGEPTGGFAAFMQTLAGGRISIGAMALGIAQGAFEQAVAYARERKQFDKPIGAFQGVSHMIADMAVGIHAARHLVYHAARMRDAGREFANDAAMAKLFASEVAMKTTFNAIQVFGGNGFSREFPLERMYRDAKLCTIGEGTSEIQRLVIARNVLGRLDDA